jgi:hypothetical protein
MTFEPVPTRSGYITLGAAIIFGALAVWLINLLPQQNDPTTLFRLGLGLLLTLVLTSLAVYGTVIALKLRYNLSRNGLAIQWGLTQHRIPVDHIEAIIPAKGVAESARFWELNFGGLRYGWGWLPGFKPLKFFAAAPLTDCLLVVTGGRTYVISPHQADHFLRAWQSRRSLGPTQAWSGRPRRSWPLNTPLFIDPLAGWLLGLAGLLWLALLAYLAFSFAALPAALPVHFNALGHADRIAEKSSLFILPVGGAIVWVVNALLGELVYQREKVAAYLLWGSAVVMQVCLWLALLSLAG